ncbi:MAG: family membership [Candidatus Zixiibacteriota bacterium]
MGIETMNFRRVIKWLFKFISYVALAIVAVIVIALFSFWIELGSDVTLPTPTGSFAVGRATFHWVDSLRVDSLSPQPLTKRELGVWIWYPASRMAADSVVAYDHADWESASDTQLGFALADLFWRDSRKIHPHSIKKGRISDKQAKYPIILMKSGIGTMAADYTTYAEDLASHGYVVVGSDAPYSTFRIVFPGGRVVERTAEGNPGEFEYFSEDRIRVLNRLLGIWTEDTRFVLNKLEQLNSAESSNQFFGRLDIQSVGVFGHSFGGATAAQFCLDEPRCKAGVDLDGAPYGSVIKNGIHKPFMFLLADHGGETDSVSVQIRTNIENIYDSWPQEHYWIRLQGAKHFNFSDRPLQTEIVTSRIFGATGSIGGRRGLEVSSSCLRTFFDRYLKGSPAASIRDLPGKYPEVRFERKLNE